MGDLIQLPIHKGSNETYGYIPPEKILKAALKANLEDVIVLGWNGNEFYAAGSNAHVGDNFYMIERFKELLMQRSL